MGRNNTYNSLFIVMLLILGAIVVKAGISWSGHRLVTHNGGIPESAMDMVKLDQSVPGVIIDLRYAGRDNFTGQPIYDNNSALLRRGTAEKLKEAQKELEGKGYRLKIWDAYRPSQAQFKLWEKMPDSRFVINPNKGYSYHSRGVAVDLTIVDAGGQEVSMPTGFDDFTARADRDYSDVSSEAARNARFLEDVMTRHGFHSIFYEWWHFVDTQADSYPVEKEVQTSFTNQNKSFQLEGE